MVDLPTNEQHVVILLGPPGSGKGTQAKRVTQELNIPHISTGDILRENIKSETELGRRAKEFMNAGRLVPDALVLDMLFERVLRKDCKPGYLLDGFPRTIPQAESLDQFLESKVHLVAINLAVSDEIIVKRISGRLSCTVCGHVRNRFLSPPKLEGICDLCGGELIQRPDDRSEVVKERLLVYAKQTAPLIDYYERKGILHTIDGEQEAFVISDLILNLIAR
ncbi:adenylate kinase [Waddlia chondrophila]|uniref:Adenylate kinase n=1 Tax=Waddlia chondrophila (strain ATCC VR-1470 / WSU 86-1044) TaxID=716544 RepID=D6YWU6_WADCW|nr:adenylate kinase [Waddlia chondrophila]ADI38607.1 adenylate kinase [Waddlia chondrophila WSU 86-1044]